MNYQIGRKDIDTWMKTGNIMNMEDVKTELRKRYLRNVENTDTSLHIEISTSKTLDRPLELPNYITSVVFICPWVTTIKDNVLTDLSYLKNVYFAEFSSLAIIGNSWLRGCTSLESVFYCPFPKLHTVGDLRRH